MPRTRCLQHPRRKVAHLVNLGAPGALDALVCNECAQKVIQGRADGANSKARVEPITLIPLPTPILLQTMAGAPRGIVHISDERIREVGSVTRCGAVLKNATVVKDEAFRVGYCQTCGQLTDFETAVIA